MESDDCPPWLPTDYPIASLQRLLKALRVPFDPLRVEKAIYSLDTFPFVSLLDLEKVLQSWGLETLPVQVAAEDFSALPLPSLAFLAETPGVFVVAEAIQEGRVSYWHPKHGCCQDTTAAFHQKGKGVLLLVAPSPRQPDGSVPADEGVSGRVAAESAAETTTPEPLLALVTTLVHARYTLESFIGYHLSAGIDHIFLFFDDPTDACIDRARQYEQVTVLVRGDALDQEWQQGRLYASLQSQLHAHDVRQLLNVEVAIRLALSRQMGWIVHLDVDELLYPGPGTTLPAHFAWLDQQNVTQVTFPNYEAVAEQVEVQDYFREVTLFKKHYSHCPPASQPREKPHLNVPYKASFVAYSNGKSAARLEPGLLPWGNHRFCLHKGRVRYQKKHQVRFSGETYPVVLHYAECGFSHFYQKYLALGNFPDYFPGGEKIADKIPFRIQARDMVQTAPESEVKEFYADRVLLTDSTEIDTLLAQGIITRLDEVARRVASLQGNPYPTPATPS